MLDAGVPLAKEAEIVSWSASTMIRMAKRYGHFSLNEFGESVESSNGNGIEAGVLGNLPRFGGASKSSSA